MGGRGMTCCAGIVALTGVAWLARSPAREWIVESGTAAPVRRTRGEGCTLTGALLDQDGRALEGLELELRECATASDRACWGDTLAGVSAGDSFATVTGGSDGSFAFRDVPPGGWALFVRGSLELPRAVYFFRIGADQRARHMPLALARGLYLRGRVLGPRGEAAPRALLAATGLDVSFRERARSADDGTFKLGPLVKGCYSLEATGTESEVSATRVVGADELVLLRLEPGGVLLVRARDEQGAPATVQLGLQGASSRSAAGSELRLARLRPGVYDLVAHTPDGRIAVVQGLQVEAGFAPVPLDIVVRQACALGLRLTGAEGRSWRALWKGTVVAEGTLEPGGETRVLFPPGPASISWSRGRDEPAEHVHEIVLSESAEPIWIEYEVPERQRSGR